MTTESWPQEKPSVRHRTHSVLKKTFMDMDDSACALDVFILPEHAGRVQEFGVFVHASSPFQEFHQLAVRSVAAFPQFYQNEGSVLGMKF